MYGDQCAYCEGTVREKIVKQEALKHKTGFVILEDVSIGVCDRCGNRYDRAEILQMVEALATGKIAPEKTPRVPVAHVS